MTANTIVELVESAAEAIRAANHRTIDPGHQPVPDVYRILAELTALADRVPQLCDQLAANLDRRHELRGLRLDAIGQQHHPDPGHAITTATDALHTAAALAGELAQALAHARNACAVIADNPPHVEQPEGLQS